MIRLPRSMMSTDIADLVGGRHVGEPRTIKAIGPFDTITPDCLGHWTGPVAALLTTKIACLLVFVPETTDSYRRRANCLTLIEVPSPRLAFIQVCRALAPEPRAPAGISAAAAIHVLADIDPSAVVSEFVSIGRDCHVGPRTVLAPGVVLYPNTTIGADATVHANAVLGARGFGLERNASGRLEEFPHYGGVIIEDDVEIGAGTCIDRGTFKSTRVCRGAKIDNLVHIAHNVAVGRDAVIVANSMIAGSVEIEDGAWIAPSASIREGLRIGRSAFVGLGAVVTHNVESGTTVAGSPARPIADFKRLVRVWAAGCRGTV